MDKKARLMAAGTLILILIIILIGPMDIFTHGYFCDEVDYTQISEEDFLEQIDLGKTDFEMQFSPENSHFKGFEIFLSDIPAENTGFIELTVIDGNGKALDTIETELKDIKEKTWYKLFTSANLQKGKVYTLKFSVTGSPAGPSLVAVDSDYLPDETVSGNILVGYAYGESTFTFQEKVLIIFFMIAVWGYGCGGCLKADYRKYVKIAAAGLFMTAILSWNYMYNSMDNQNVYFEGFQADSETLVTGMIYADQKGIGFSDSSENGFGMGRYYDVKGRLVSYDLEFLTNEYWRNGYSRSEPAVAISANLYTKEIAKEGNYIEFENGEIFQITKAEDTGGSWIFISLDSARILTEAKYGSLENVSFYNLDKEKLPPGLLTAYTSQYGLQGKVFKRLARYMPVNEVIANLNLLCSIGTAVVFVLIVMLLACKYNRTLAGCFFVTFWLSPWIVNFARNFYWVEFTWFIPMAAGLFCAWKIHSSKCRMISYIIAFIAITGKCLCGYEYISVIMMGLISFPLVDFAAAVLRKDKDRSLLLARTIFILGIAALLGFAAALCLHAPMRGNGDLLEGLKTIFREDVLRRTQGADINEYNVAVHREAFNASVWEVYCKYFHFPTEVLAGITGNWFPLICIVPLCIFGYEYKEKKLNTELLSMYIVFFVTSVSWFCLAKAHSYIHTHMSYVLWYFGFIQTCFYIILHKLAGLFKKASPDAKEKIKVQ
ncbi:MAG: hypothetical protein HFI68_07495 [Lachnospiraceae bacterium]|nr:hypothetical protein [Lachnospiraceae bacterium]